MENRNGQGIFYGVIGVATLIVAIVGATFAYFSASANSANNAIATTSATAQNFTLTEVKTGLRTALIPVKTTGDANTAAFSKIIGTTADADDTITTCEDTVGNDVCSVYRFTVTNPATYAQQAYFKIVSISNSFTNLHYAIYQGNADSTAPDLNGTATATSTTSTADNTLLVTSTVMPSSGEISLTSLDHNFAASESKTYTIVLWVEETGNDQTTADAGKAFAAGINISTGTGSGVTGILNTTGV